MTPDTLPDLLREALEEIGLKSVDSWWSDLGDSARADLLGLWDSCSEQHFGPGFASEQPMRIRMIGIPSDPLSDTFEGFWHQDFFEYLVNHEEFYKPPRTFHVCTAEPRARQAVKEGRIDSHYVCPLGKPTCPMRNALKLADGKSIRLSLTFVPR